MSVASIGAAISGAASKGNPGSYVSAVQQGSKASLSGSGNAGSEGPLAGYSAADIAARQNTPKAVTKAATDTAAKKKADAAAAEQAAAQAKIDSANAAAAAATSAMTADTTTQKADAARLGTLSEAASTSGADAQAKQYAGYTAAGTGKTPAETMALAQSAANQMGQQYSDQAIQQAIKAAKTSGAMGGQAALAATGQAANAYAQGQTQGQMQYFNALNLGADLNKAMTSTTSTEGLAARQLAAQRQAELQNLTQEQLGQAATQAANTASQQTQLASQEKMTKEQLASQESIAAAQNKLEKNQQSIDLFGKGIGAIGGIAGMFSDKRLKEDIKESPTKGLADVGAYDYKYKGEPRQERGVMAQDLEKTSMAPAVMDTPNGKMIDTRRLTTMNTAALSEQERRMQKLEKMLSAMRRRK